MGEIIEFIVLFLLFATILISYSLYIIKKYENGILNEIKKFKSDIKKEIENTSDISITMMLDDRIGCCRDLLSLIDTLIENEIVNERRYEIFLDKKNNNLDIDNVISSVATNVFESIRKDVITDPNNILTEKQIMRYIQQKTFSLYLMYLKEHVASQL